MRTLEDVLTLARVSHLVLDEYLHPEYVRCAEHFLHGKIHHVSTAAEAEALGMKRASVSRVRILAASLAHNLERFGWAAVEQVLVQRASALVSGQPAVELFCLIEFDSYDAADLTLGVVGRPKKPMVPVARPVDDVAVDDQLLPIDAPADLVELPLSAIDKKPEVGVQKVLQNEGFSVMLVRIGNRCHVL